MRALGFLIIVLGLAAGAAFMTKPSAADAEAALREQITLAVAKQDLGEGRSTGENLALAACKLRPSDCYDLLRSGMDVIVTDQTFFTKVELDGFNRRATCYGAFTKFVCPGGLKDTSD